MDTEKLQDVSKKAWNIFFFFVCTAAMGTFSFILLPLISPSSKEMPFMEHWAIATAVLSISFLPHLIGGRGWCPICMLTDKIERKLSG